MSQVFKAKKKSDDIRISFIENENRYFMTVNGQHVGFLSVDDFHQMFIDIQEHLEKKKPALKKETIAGNLFSRAKHYHLEHPETSYQDAIALLKKK